MKKRTYTILTIVLAAAIVIALAMLIAKMSGRPAQPQEPSSSSSQEQPAPSSSQPDESQAASTPEPVEIIMSQKELNEYIKDSDIAKELADGLEISLHDGGKFELSGKVDVTAVAGGDKLPGALALLPQSMLQNLPVSASGSAALDADSQLGVSISELKVSGITLPDSIAGEISAHMEDEIATALSELADFTLTSFEISEGRLYLKGTEG